MKSFHFIFFVILFSIPFSSLYAAEFQERSSSNKTRVLLGGLFAVHEKNGSACGYLRRSSVVKVEGMAYAIRSVNEREDLLPDAILEFDIRDTCENSNIALEEVVEMMDFKSDMETMSKPGVSGLIGATQSDISIAVARLTRLFQIPQISYSSTATILSDKSIFDYFFRTIPSDMLQARAIADLIIHFNWTYVIAINSDDTYGRDGLSGLVEEINVNYSSQICIVSKPEITELSVNGNNNYNEVIEFILQEWIANASVVVLFSQFSTAMRMLEAVEMYTRVKPESGLDMLTWVAGDSWATRVTGSLSRIVRGMIGTTPRVYTVDEFNKYLESLHPQNYTSNPWFGEYWEEVFNCTLNNSNSRTSDKMVCENSLRLSASDLEEDISGVTNVIDAVYSFAYAIHNMMDDLFFPNNETSWQNITKKRFSKHVLNGKLLREYLYNVSFNSSSCREAYFDASGDMNGDYAIVNMDKDSNINKVGTWDSTNLLQVTGDIQWSTGEDVPVSVCSAPCGIGHHPVLVPRRTDCCWTCDPCLGDNIVSNGSECMECSVGTSPDDFGGECQTNPIVYLSWTNPWAIIVILGSCIGLAATAFIAAVFVKFNMSKVIKASSRELCAVLFIGVVACYILPFFYIAKPSIPICTIRRLGIGLSFSICFSPMLMRANRIYRVFHVAPQTPKFAGPLHQVLFSCCFIGIEVLISIVWLIVEKPSIKYSYGSRITELRCGESPYIGLAILLLYNFSLLALSTYFAFLSRKIPANFNETKLLGVTLYSVCIIWLASVPTYFATVRFGVVYQTTSLLMAVLLSATTILCCLLLPKAVIVLWYSWMKRGDESNKKYSTAVETEMTSNGSL